MNGLWTVEFGSSAGIFGTGVAVFQDGRILGGDGQYFYVGDFEIDGKRLTATLKVAPFVPGARSVFATVGQTLMLRLVGELTSESSAIAQGYPEGKPELKFGAKLTKRA
jgi:hypothetical protein